MDSFNSRIAPGNTDAVNGLLFIFIRIFYFYFISFYFICLLFAVKSVYSTDQ